MEKISAIIKTNNSGNTICETLESIREFDEIIILDTHSNDDTIDIAKEYKAKIIFVDKNEFAFGLNNAIKEAKNDWILFLKGDEIIPSKLLIDLEEYVLKVNTLKNKNKKIKNCLTLPIKEFYLNKELKLARNRKMKFFNKNFVDENLAPKQTKVFNYNKKNKIKNGYIFKYKENDFSKNFSEILEEKKTLIKKINRKNKSLFFSIFTTFIYFYIFKKGIFEGIRGFIYSFNKVIEKYILEVMLLEKANKK